MLNLIASTFKRCLVALCLSAFTALGYAAETDWPEVSSETKPWTRWWWHGSAVTKADLTAEMEIYAAAGLGGLEITPIYGVRGEEDEFIDYLTPRWMDMLEHVLVEAERLDMGVDMATGNGWPFGGPWVDADAACKNMVLGTYELSEGQSLDQRVLHVQRPMVRAIGRRVNIAELKEPIRENADLQGMALEQVRFEKPLPLAALVAYGDDGSTVGLMDRVDGEGKLDWKAPPGKWTLYAVFQGWHGKMVERAGPGGEGDVIDHFDGRALDDYLKRFDEAFAGRDIGGLRGFFNDSYEVDDASGNADFTARIFDEFERRRGYDLRKQLPALFGRDEREENSRVLCDYRETISDLLLEEFTEPWREWAHGHGAITRNQAHGSPANILDLYAASDIPETEGTDRIQFMAAASAAHVTGKRLVSAEAATWLDEHFLGTLAETKRWVDNYFLGGVNHICYHGTCFSPPDDPWPGRLFYASLELQPTNPQWRHFHALNDYVTRCQSFLQPGQPDNDVLVYYPIHDEWSRRGRATLAHFNGEARGTTARRGAEDLLDAGYSLDFVSDRQLAVTRGRDGALQVGGASYQALILPQCESMPLATLRHVVSLTKGGATLVIQGALPKDVPGNSDLENQRKELAGLIGRLQNALSAESGQLGAGRVKLAPRASDGLAAIGLAPESLVEKRLQYLRRKHDDGVSYFIVNAGDQQHDAWTPLRASASAVVLFDPMSGTTGAAVSRAADDGGIEVRLQLEPGQTCIVRTYDRAIEGTRFPYKEKSGDARELGGSWSIDFVEGGPTLPDAVEVERLGSWTELSGDAAKNFSGTARYTLEFDAPATEADVWLLDLGEVRESAAVRLNGEILGTAFCAPYHVRIPAEKLSERNRLEIDVANLMANRIADLDRRGAPWKEFYNVNFAARRPENRGRGGVFDAARWAPLPSGLLGPVTLTPIELTSSEQ
jgi:hypothetical protein